MHFTWAMALETEHQRYMSHDIVILAISFRFAPHSVLEGYWFTLRYTCMRRYNRVNFKTTSDSAELNLAVRPESLVLVENPNNNV